MIKTNELLILEQLLSENRCVFVSICNTGWIFGSYLSKTIRCMAVQANYNRILKLFKCGTSKRCFLTPVSKDYFLFLVSTPVSCIFTVVCIFLKERFCFLTQNSLYSFIFYVIGIQYNHITP